MCATTSKISSLSPIAIDLKESYEDCIRTLIPYTELVRDDKGQKKYALKLHDINALFNSKVWEDKAKKGGHKKFEHKLTHIVVEFPNHGSLKTSVVVSVLYNIQEHINILFNNYFAFSKKKDWKSPKNYTVKDYELAVERYKKTNASTLL